MEDTDVTLSDLREFQLTFLGPDVPTSLFNGAPLSGFPFHELIRRRRIEVAIEGHLIHGHTRALTNMGALPILSSSTFLFHESGRYLPSGWLRGSSTAHIERPFSFSITSPSKLACYSFRDGDRLIFHCARPTRAF